MLTVAYICKLLKYLVNAIFFYDEKIVTLTLYGLEGADSPPLDFSLLHLK